MGAAQRVTVGGIHLAYEVSGSQGGPPLVLLHALGERGADWAPVLDRFAEHFRVFVPDLRGHGDSDWPGEYTFRLMRDDVLGFLDRLGLAGVTLAGHSMGGAVAYLVAMERPDLVERLIVEDAAPPFPRRRALPERPDGPLDFDWAVVPAIVGQVNGGDPEAWAGLAAITAPTLLIGGGAASHIQQDRLAEAAARIPRCDLVTIPAGHLVHATSPARFADAVLGWLGIDGSGRRGPAGADGSAGRGPAGGLP
ncbi:MAG TPA: alpha/beta fold hydrolase [Streptosporangiaceae bacterium]|nr:alpha/beta fold hydrolase [Streptosporangiaceae bacterium]